MHAEHPIRTENREARAPARVDRRGFLVGAAATMAALAWPARAWAEPAPTDALERALGESGLVYISPLKGDGGESACHAEVWFVTEGADVLVVTNAERWRAAAIGRGLDRARLWVGDHGVWKRANEAWKKSPTTDARGRLDGDAAAHARALTLFGAKYAEGWDKWGPRFEEGLASGERVLIRYTPEA